MAALPCVEDPSKLVGEEWLCDDGCNTCTCGPDGTVTAFGCEVQGGQGPPASNHLEQITVAVAASAVIACLVCFVVLCCVMYCVS